MINGECASNVRRGIQPGVHHPSPREIATDIPDLAGPQEFAQLRQIAPADLLVGWCIKIGPLGVDSMLPQFLVKELQRRPQDGEMCLCEQVTSFGFTSRHMRIVQFIEEFRLTFRRDPVLPDWA